MKSLTKKTVMKPIELLILGLCLITTGQVPEAIADGMNQVESSDRIAIPSVQRSKQYPRRGDSLQFAPNTDSPSKKLAVPEQSSYGHGGKGENLDEVNRRSSGTMIKEGEHDLLHKIIFYLPNRVFDLWDIFRGDVGLGSAGGFVFRATRYGQFGYRYVDPFSLRLGPQGRRFPFFIEREDEYGFGSDFIQSENRYVTPYELGLGLDLIVVGAYAGLSLDEAWDFLTGWVMIDPKSDDF